MHRQIQIPAEPLVGLEEFGGRFFGFLAISGRVMLFDWLSVQVPFSAGSERSSCGRTLDAGERQAGALLNDLLAEIERISRLEIHDLLKIMERKVETQKVDHIFGHDAVAVLNSGSIGVFSLRVTREDRPI